MAKTNEQVQMEIDATELVLFEKRVGDMLRKKYPDSVDLASIELKKEVLIRLNFIVFFNKHQVKGDHKAHYFVGIREEGLGCEEKRSRSEAEERSSWLTKSFVSEYPRARAYAKSLIDHFDLLLHRDFL